MSPPAFAQRGTTRPGFAPIDRGTRAILRVYPEGTGYSERGPMQRPKGDALKRLHPIEGCPHDGRVVRLGAALAR
jgi:hypothetical protein